MISLQVLFCNVFNSKVISPQSFKNYTENNVKFLKSFLLLWHIFSVFFFVSSNFRCCFMKFRPNFFKNFHISLKSFLKNFHNFSNFYKCDAIQQKVHTIGKLVFPNAVEIGRGDHKEHLKKSLAQEVRQKSDILECRTKG